MIKSSKPVACSIINAKSGKSYFKIWFPYTDDFITGTPVSTGIFEKMADLTTADVLEHTFTIALDKFGKVLAIEW